MTETECATERDTPMNRRLDAQRSALFGPPEEVKQKLVRVALGELVPELLDPLGSAVEHRHALAKTQVVLHPLALPQFAHLVRAWLAAGLIEHVQSFDKFYEVADDGKRWGAHAWGNAFDVNSEHNAIRTHGAAAGQRGSTHELEAIARPLGWVCGRAFPMGRAPRHFELFALPAPVELDTKPEEDVKVVISGGEAETAQAQAVDGDADVVRFGGEPLFESDP